MKKRILIVEDEQDCAELLSFHLQKENYQTDIARNGEEAIEAVQCRTPDAILLDIMLPELNGWEVCRILRESCKGKSLPIIMVSALSDEEARIKGLSLGADDFISKPYPMKELLLKVRKHIDRQQTFRQLQTREQELNTALHYMVHELRNSMTAIGGVSSLALRKDIGNKFMRTINSAAAHAESLLSDASLLSRLENGGELLFLKSVDIAPLVDETIAFFRDTAKKTNVEIVAVHCATSPVRGSETAIRQIFINLVSNAVKYNREGGTVRIFFEETDKWVDISIQDEGAGIPNTEIARIFDKFYRAAGSELLNGAGLGLYIVRLLVDAMGGKVMVASRPGRGSTFTVSFAKAEAAVLLRAAGKETVKEEVNSKNI